jgi:hypothetical protein
MENQPMRSRKFAILLMICADLLSGAKGAIAQDLGHKLPGLIGLEAGKVPEPGLYFIDRLVWYEADEIRDRNGNVIPIGPFNLQALSNAAGVMYTTKLGKQSTYFTATAAAPLTHFTTNVQDHPEASIDKFGLSDIFIQPARFGWRFKRFDAVASYGLYLPTGRFQLFGGKTVSSGQVTHQFSAGGSIYANKNRDAFVTALASYDLNRRKRDIDITRGDTIQIQGGAGFSRMKGTIEAGAAAYALWQVRDDRGTALPPVLRGGRDRVYGAGPEVAVFVKAIRSQIRTRYVWDIGVRSRPSGNLFVVGLNVVLQRPPRPPAGPPIP